MDLDSLTHLAAEATRTQSRIPTPVRHTPAARMGGSTNAHQRDLGSHT